MSALTTIRQYVFFILLICFASAHILSMLLFEREDQNSINPPLEYQQAIRVKDNKFRISNTT
jgi:hypothetical protein